MARWAGVVVGVAVIALCAYSFAGWFLARGRPALGGLSAVPGVATAQAVAATAPGVTPGRTTEATRQTTGAATSAASRSTASVRGVPTATTAQAAMSPPTVTLTGPTATAAIAPRASATVVSSPPPAPPESAAQPTVAPVPTSTPTTTPTPVVDPTPRPLASLPLYPGATRQPATAGAGATWALAAPAPEVERWMTDQWRAAGLRFICQRAADTGDGRTESRWWDAEGYGYGFAAIPDPAIPGGGTRLTITGAPGPRWQTC